MLNKQQIDTEICQFALLDAERGQPKRLCRRNKDTTRVRLKGQNTDRPPSRLGEILGLCD